MASGWLQGWLLVKLQVEAPPEELQSFKVASAFGSFTIQEPKLSGWSEAMAEATLQPCLEASSDCPYYHSRTTLKHSPFSTPPKSNHSMKTTTTSSPAEHLYLPRP